MTNVGSLSQGTESRARSPRQPWEKSIPDASMVTRSRDWPGGKQRTVHSNQNAPWHACKWVGQLGQQIFKPGCAECHLSETRRAGGESALLKSSFSGYLLRTRSVPRHLDVLGRQHKTAGGHLLVRVAVSFCPSRVWPGM